jgi:hypothetical protein
LVVIARRCDHCPRKMKLVKMIWWTIPSTDISNHGSRMTYVTTYCAYTSSECVMVAQTMPQQSKLNHIASPRLAVPSPPAAALGSPHAPPFL